MKSRKEYVSKALNSSDVKESLPSYTKIFCGTDDAGLFIQIGAPPEVVARLEEACSSAAAMGRQSSRVGEDPALDQFMEAYCEMLTKYEQELSKPFKEAVLFLSRIECQFKALSLSSDLGDELSLKLSFALYRLI